MSRFFEIGCLPEAEQEKLAAEIEDAIAAKIKDRSADREGDPGDRGDEAQAPARHPGRPERLREPSLPGEGLSGP